MVGISLSTEDKVLISRRLISLGVAYVEGGWPGSNAKDATFFERWDRELAAEAALVGTRLVAFGSTRRRGTTAAADSGCQALLACGSPCVTLVAKAWDAQVERVLGCSLDENLAMIEETVAFFKAHGREVALDAEHFFDGERANREYAMACLAAAFRAGADCLVLCDTNGGSLPWDVEAATARVRDTLPLCRIGIHCHNDTGLAVANSLAAVRSGATVVQGCMNGYGERTGNADLVAVAGTLELKMKLRCLPQGRLPRLTETAHAVASICRQQPAVAQPYAGSAAFAHKGGLHVAALERMPEAYNHIQPELVGNTLRSVVSELSGRGNLRAAAASAGLPPMDEATSAAVLAQIKLLERDGASFEAAGASVEMLIARSSPGHMVPFHVREFNVLCSNRSFAAAGDAVLPAGTAAGYRAGSQSVNTAIVKVELPSGETLMQAAEGNGPVNALAMALRSVLAPHYPALNSVSLRDYHVDLLGMEGTSAAVTRVAIDFQRDGATWRTVGAHSSIIEASFRALVDGLEWAITHCDEEGCALPGAAPRTQL